MARVALTPTANSSGIYVLNAPFTIDTTTIFKCEAIRTFPELVRKGVNVYTEYYEPAGVSAEDYALDAAAGAAIVTLKSADGTLVYVPNTYIASIPGQTGASYERNVIVIDCGPVPNYVDFNLINAELNEVVMRNVGVSATTTVNTMAYEGVFTDEQHVAMEVQRKANIRQNVTLSEQINTLTARNTELTTLNNRLIEIVKKAGLVV